MRLEDIDLHGLGEFGSEKSAFVVKKHHLEEPWGYVYTTPRLLLKVDQHGPDKVQFSPPGGTVFVRRERYQTYPPFFALIKTPDGRAFSNFYRPIIGGGAPGEEPEEFGCEYRPEAAIYHVRRDGISCETVIFVPADDAVVVMTCTISNAAQETKAIEVFGVLRPHLAAGSLAPWDVPALYQRMAYSNEQRQLFYMELRSPAGVPELRKRAFVLTDLDAPDGVEVSYWRFVGEGSLDNPQAFCSPQLMSVDPSTRHIYGEFTTGGSVNGEQGIAALRKRVALEQGESFGFTIVLGSPDEDAKGYRPSLEELTAFSRYFDADARSAGRRGYLESLANVLDCRSIATPDDCLNRYVNEYLPLQLAWVRTLDRGWPTGMRGVRDHAQDTAALVPLDPAAARKSVLELFSVQRSDGWFPRQYSVSGRHGAHDLRGYVDGGVWVWELLYDYLCWSKDFDLLREEVAWLDTDEAAPISRHVAVLIGYYLARENLGEHGLCLIRQGDWNDSVNRAGLEGRGESAMVSCQVVLMLRQAAYILAHAAVSGFWPEPARSDYMQRAEELKSNILVSALNDEGYLNGVFTDKGEWVFSCCDPDGRRRVSVPVNAFGIISGVLTGKAADRALEVLIGLKQRDGWPLFYPPIGDPPIDKLGRIGQGDLSPGLGENGSVYNHGSHGFFGRAAAAANRGDLLAEILSYMFPYDQERHPVSRSKTAPYGVVNHWKTAPGMEGRGGDAFLSGSISTGLRNVYDGLFGIRPMVDGLALDPALPRGWKKCSVAFRYVGADVELTYEQQVPGGCAAVAVVNGREVSTRRRDAALVKEVLVVPDEALESGRLNRIVCVLRRLSAI